MMSTLRALIWRKNYYSLLLNIMRSFSDIFGIKNPGRVPTSVHNLSTKRFFTTHVGQARPVYSRDIYPRDKFSISPSLVIESFPTVLPFFGSLSARVDFFFCPLSMFYGWIESEQQITFEEYLKMPSWRCDPILALDQTSEPSLDHVPAGSSYAAYGPGSVFDMIGRPTIHQGSLVDKTNGVPAPSSLYPTHFGLYGPQRSADSLLSFYAVYNKYYANPQEEYFPLVSVSASGTNVPNYNTTYASRRTLELLPALLRRASTLTNGDGSYSFTGVPDILQNTSQIFGSTFMASTVGKEVSTFLSALRRCDYMDAGIPLVTYSMDYFRGRLNEDRAYESAAPVSSDNSVTINSMRFANKIQQFADKFDITSGRFSDVIRSLWRVRLRATNTPSYLGGFSQSITFNSITQMADASQTPLGWQVTRANSTGRARRLFFKSDTFGCLLAIMSIRPQVVYDQINWPEDLQTRFGDKYAPDLANLGFQPMPEYELNPYGDVTPTNGQGEYKSSGNSIGRHLAWIPQMTDVDRAHGLFRWPYSLSSMLPLYFPSVSAGDDLSSKPDTFPVYRPVTTSYTTYVFPSRWNRLFADTSASAHNFYGCLSLGIRARRTIPYRQMPSL